MGGRTLSSLRMIGHAVVIADELIFPMLKPSPQLSDDVLLSDLTIPAHIRNALAAQGVRTVGEVRKIPDKTLFSFPKVGHRSIR
jgi:hypothetical protein